MSSDPRIGTEVAGYRIERLLGRGGMGLVYLATHIRLGRKVALKLLASELADDPKFRERFVRESKLAASLDHPNIIPIYDADEVDGVLFIAMRYVEGTDLKALLEAEGHLDPERALGIVGQVAGALDAAHARGLIHRDVKPGNMLITPRTDLGEEEHVYLSDFGLTKRAASDSGITATGQFVGSLDYAAPEQFEGKPLDGRADQYSLGCVLYQCLTGEVPFRRENEAALVYAHLLAPPPPVSTVRPELPAAIDPVVARGMAKKPEDRFGSCGELAGTARRALGVGSGERAAPPLPPPRSRRGLIALAGAGAVVV
ncbi:MAG TPA: serine/threonine-protein kinase, partial [Actinomycetota bacterium]